MLLVSLIISVVNIWAILVHFQPQAQKQQKKYLEKISSIFEKKKFLYFGMEACSAQAQKLFDILGWNFPAPSQEIKNFFYFSKTKLPSHFRMTAHQVVKRKNLPYSKVTAN